jgi:hypothetical protein
MSEHYSHQAARDALLTMNSVTFTTSLNELKAIKQHGMHCAQKGGPPNQKRITLVCLFLVGSGALPSLSANYP